MENVDLVQDASGGGQHGLAKAPRRITRGRMALLFLVMLVTAAGNTAMQSIMPSIGAALDVADVWISLAYTGRPCYGWCAPPIGRADQTIAGARR